MADIGFTTTSRGVVLNAINKKGLHYLKEQFPELTLGELNGMPMERALEILDNGDKNNIAIAVNGDTRWGAIA